MKPAFIALGSNLGDPLINVEKAMDRLAAHDSIDVTGQSPWYRSLPVGPGAQPDYVNGAAEIKTTLDAESLLDVLQAIESDLGRERSVAWAARTIDLDLLWYNDETIHTDRLIVPHPRICDRNFVLLPLSDLAPELLLDGKSVLDRAQEISHNGIWKLQAAQL